jgi:hypothetical protein
LAESLWAARAAGIIGEEVFVGKRCEHNSNTDQ